MVPQRVPLFTCGGLARQGSAKQKAEAEGQAYEKMIEVEDTTIALDASLCDCFADTETCLLGLCCPCLVFGQTRARAGLQACLPAAMTLLVPVLVCFIEPQLYQAYYLGAVLLDDTGLSKDYLACVENTANVPALGSLAQAVWCMPGSVLAVSLQLGFLLFSCQLLARNRTALQRALGLPETRILNLLLYLCVFFPGLCALCQEARAVKARWQANGQQPLTSSIQRPLPPGPPTAKGSPETPTQPQKAAKTAASPASPAAAAGARYLTIV